MEDYRASIARGETLLNSGNVRKALDELLSLKGRLQRSTSELEQLIGICWRMSSEYERATTAFGKAYELADNDVDKGRIMRDWAMVPLAQEHYDDAFKCLEESLELIRGHNVVEYAVTMGFIGRVHFAQGDREAALSYFRTADLQLRTSHAPRIYELNNLVWWMKAAPFRARIKVARRALPLAYRAGNARRLAQIALLVWYRPLALRIST